MTCDLRAQYLRGLGYLVLKVDNRGSLRRGHAFEAVGYLESSRTHLCPPFAALCCIVLDPPTAAPNCSPKTRTAHGRRS